MESRGVRVATPTEQNCRRLAALFPGVVEEWQDAAGNIRQGVNYAKLRLFLEDNSDKEQSSLRERTSASKVGQGSASKVGQGRASADPSSFAVSAYDDTVPAEHFEFSWVGKRAALIETNRPSDKTLRPVIEASTNWESTENLYLEGDNLEVLKLLQESYRSRVDVIYIDPPYNTGSDFIYRDNFAISREAYAQASGALDEVGTRLFRNADSNGRFHSQWCSMFYARLLLARNLLADTGIIYISIDDNEVDNARKICSEVFSSTNFLAEFPRVTKRGGKSTERFAKNHDYVLAYAKDHTQVRLSGVAHNDSGFRHRDAYYAERGPYKLNQTLDYNTLQYNKSMDYPITIDGVTYVPGGDAEQYAQRQAGNHGRHDWVWRWSTALFSFGLRHGWVEVSKTGRIYTKTYLRATIEKNQEGEYAIAYTERTKPVTTLDFTDNKYSNDNSNKELTRLMGASLFEYAKPTALVRDLIAATAHNERALVLDFFSGSGTTAQAVMQLNAQDGGQRRYILVQLPERCSPRSIAALQGYETIGHIARERIRLATEQLHSESSADFDGGVRVFRLDESNWHRVTLPANEYTQDKLEQLTCPLRAERSHLDLLFGCIISLGLPLSGRVATVILDEHASATPQNTSQTAPQATSQNTSQATSQTTSQTADDLAYDYMEGVLLAYFGRNIPPQLGARLAGRRPQYALFSDSSFGRSADKLELKAIFARLSPQTRLRFV